MTFSKYISPQSSEERSRPLAAPPPPPTRLSRTDRSGARPTWRQAASPGGKQLLQNQLISALGPLWSRPVIRHASSVACGTLWLATASSHVGTTSVQHTKC
eukprot:TRINITY_DN39603_c0_g3_i2.p1 TRINITY_DN39603_c0_g3~~TRINITY_DN39603_c0_g3_i2.p1  ORF type:complete len:101 (+),score=8.63 TRINITY_DN39603_c0_g3_i2:698-1000(+)